MNLLYSLKWSKANAVGEGNGSSFLSSGYTQAQNDLLIKPKSSRI